jgi:hypothetical protein
LRVLKGAAGARRTTLDAIVAYIAAQLASGSPAAGA